MKGAAISHFSSVQYALCRITLSERSGSVCGFRSTTFPITVMDSSEGLFRSAESLLSFKSILSSLLGAFFLLVLPVTLLLFLVLEIVTHLSGVLVCRVTLSDKGTMLRHQSIVFLFQLGGLRLQIAQLRRFPFDVVSLDMLGNILVGFFKSVDSGSIFLAANE